MTLVFLIIFAVLLFLIGFAVLVLILVGKKYGATGILVFAGICVAIMAPLLLLSLVGVSKTTMSSAPTIIRTQSGTSVPGVPTPLPGLSVELSGEPTPAAPSLFPGAPSSPVDTPSAVRPINGETGTVSETFVASPELRQVPLTSSGNRQMARRSTPAGVDLHGNLVIEYRSSTTGWGSSEFDKFTASHYPSMGDCAQPIAQLVSEFVDENKLVANSGDAESPMEFEVVAEDSVKGTPFISSFVQNLRKLIPGVTVTLVVDEPEPASEAPAEVPSEPTKLKLTLFANTNQSDDSLPAQMNPAVGPVDVFRASTLQGTVHCRLDHSDVRTELTTKFSDKPWVFHYDEVISQAPGRKLIVGYSDPLSGSESSARASAFRSAQDQVRISTNSGVRLELDERQIVDRFAQKLTRPYGDVWREAVLVDLTSPSLQEVAGRRIAVAVNSNDQRQSLLVSIGLLVGVVILFCLAANGLTQGYYRRRLGIGAGSVLFLAVIVVLLNFA